MNKQRNTRGRVFFFGLFALLAVAVIYLLSPYLGVIAVALVTFVMLKPLYNWFLTRKRIEGRKSESEESLKLRLLNAQKEMDQRDRYEHIIVNDVIDDAYRELAAIIENARKSGGEGSA